MKHVQQDLPIGVQKARASDPGIDPLKMSDDEGQFTNANNNPFPVPTNYVDGAHEEIDTRTGKVKKETEPKR